MKNKLFLATLAMSVAVPVVVAPVQAEAKDVSFKDVTKDSYAYDAITYLTGEGIIAGYGNGLFGLKDNVTRGQVSALIVRYLKLDTSKDFDNPYTDVKGNAFEKAVLAVTDAGYMGGKGKGKFEPNATLTRAEMAVVLTNVFGLKVKADYQFHDMNDSHWASSAVKALYSNGITFGSGDNKYNPNQSVTREQYAEFLYRGIHLDEDFEADPIPDKEESPTGEKPAYTNAQGEVTRAGLARLVVETVNPKVEPSSDKLKGVESGSYTEEYVQKAIALGFLNPKDYTNGFGATQKVGRAELSTWMVNGLAQGNGEYAKALKELDSTMTLLPVTEFLKGGIAKKDVPYVGVALGTGLLTSSTDGSFKPSGTVKKNEVSTVLTRYKNAVTKNPKQYSDLNEFREVATTGTNILTVTPFVHWGDNKGFENVIGKPYTYRNNGVGSIKRVIVVDETTSTAKGAYKDMFMGKAKGQNEYTLNIEYEFTPKRDMSYDQWLNSFTNKYFSAIALGNDGDVAKKYGYRVPLVENNEYTSKNTFLKTGVKNTFWGKEFEENKKGTSVRGSVDDGSGFGYIIK